MTDGNLKPQKKEAVSKLVRVVPVETYRNEKERRLVQRQWQQDKFGRFFPVTLSIDQLKPILVKARVKMEKLSLKEEDDSIVYHYKGRPMLKLNRKDGQFYSLPSEIEEYGEEAVQHQAHIVLDMLKTSGLSKAGTGKSVVTSSARQILGQLRTYKKES
jgi:hypothetical protein